MSANVIPFRDPGGHPRARLKAVLPALKGTAAQVFLCLVSYCCDGRNECWPSVATIAKDCGLRDERAVRAALRHLRVAGIIRETEQPGRPTRRRFTADWFAALPRLAPLPSNAPPAPDAPPAANGERLALAPLPSNAPDPSRQTQGEEDPRRGSNEEGYANGRSRSVDPRVDQVWQTYLATFPERRRCSLTPGRRRLIVTRLKEFSAEGLAQAIRAGGRDDWPERRKTYWDLKYFLGKTETVEKWLGLDEAPARQVASFGIAGPTSFEADDAQE